jgi:hypothetical protein
MNIWNRKRYEEEKRTFIQQRLHHAPIWSQFTLVLGMSWGAAWFCSWYLLRHVADTHAWAKNLPARYAVAFLFAYAFFFLAIRAWIEIAKREPLHQVEPVEMHTTGTMGDTSEGCFIVVALLLIGLAVSGIFLAIGGAPMLLEAAFEAAFAGVVVKRPLSGDFVLGGWKMRLLANTWKQALFGMMVLLALAAWLQHLAPQATTLAEALRTMTH